MAKQVRVGVIGTSWWADLMHLPSLKSHPSAQVTAICGRNRERAEEMAKKHDVVGVFTDYRAMIAQGNLDAIVVSTPDDTHYSMTMDALDAGLHVLCEKPLALNAAQAKEMYEKAEAAGVTHMVLFTHRYWPSYQYMRQLIEEGYVGRPFHCLFRYIGSHGRGGEYAWRFDRRHSNGAVSDLGAHMIDFAHWLVGDIARVSARLSTYVDRPGPDGQPLSAAHDAAVLALEFHSGAQGLLQASAVAHVGAVAQEQHVALHGEAGTLEVNLAFVHGQIRGARRDEQQLAPLTIPDALWGGVDPANVTQIFVTQPIGDRLFIDAILDQRSVSPSFYDGFKAQQVIDAAIRSHETGCWADVT